MKSEYYERTTMGEWMKSGGNPIGKTFVFCSSCDCLIQDNRDIKLVDRKTCPRCNSELPNKP
jgi:uncharacterized paraquat-inducible protein A